MRRVWKSRLILLPLLMTPLIGMPSGASASDNGAVHPAIPSIQDISPSSGYTKGEMQVTITGTDFTPGMKVWLGSAPCDELRWLSPLQLRCITSPHPSGTVDLLAKTPGDYLIKRKFFTYVPDLDVDPAYIPLTLGSTGKIKVSGGVPPYKFSVVKGTAQIDSSTGALTAPQSPEFGVFQVTDSRGTKSVGTYQAVDQVKGFPKDPEIDPDQAVTLTATGGEPPYQFELVSGPGKLYPDRRLYVAGTSTGEAVIRITDSASNHTDLKVTIHKPKAPPARRVAVGDNFSCALHSGVVSCWGANDLHQLGIPGAKTTNRSLPIRSLGDQVQSIAAGMHHTCVLVHGGVKCWGDNQYGQLGNGTTVPSSKPVSVLGLESGVWAVAAGDFHTCAALSRKVVCWGRNDYGQLGDGSALNSSVPVLVAGLEGNITGLAAGAFHSCAIVNQNAFCWGKNRNGQLGTGNEIDQFLPVQVSGLNDVTQISAGRAHTCAVAGGNLKCWGFNGIGTLGLNNSKSENTPYEVQLVGATVLASRQYHSCAISSGSLYCWGYNYQGQVGDATEKNRWAPVLVKGLSRVKDVATGNSHTCAMLDTDQVYCWGENFFGQLGNGGNAREITPVLVKPATPRRKAH